MDFINRLKTMAFENHTVDLHAQVRSQPLKPPAAPKKRACVSGR